MFKLDRQRGFVLPLTLIILALLTTLSMGLSQMARHSIKDVQQRKLMLENELKLKSASHWALYQLLTGTPNKREFKAGRTTLPIDSRPVQRDDVVMKVQDAAGLLGLSFYRQNIFQAVLETLTQKPQAARIAARLGDWIDADQRTRYQGMEAGDYLKAGSAMLPRNAALRSLDELLEVPGITPEIYNAQQNRPGLRDLLLAGGEENINFATAPAVLFGPFLGIQQPRAQQLLALREKANWSSLRAQLQTYPILRGEDPFQPSFQYRMNISAGEAYSVRALFRLTVSKSVPYEMVLWQYPDHDRG